MELRAFQQAADPLDLPRGNPICLRQDGEDRVPGDAGEEGASGQAYLS